MSRYEFRSTISHVALGKLINLSVPRFSSWSKENSKIYIIRLFRLNKGKELKTVNGKSKHYIYVLATIIIYLGYFWPFPHRLLFGMGSPRVSLYPNLTQVSKLTAGKSFDHSNPLPNLNIYSIFCITLHLIKTALHPCHFSPNGFST